jgi:hypothetical protein
MDIPTHIHTMSNPLTNIGANGPSPRVRMALRLYQTGACKTKREASELAGLHPNYLTMLTSPNGGSEPVKRLANDLSQMLDDETIDTSIIMRKLGRKALGKLASLMDSDNAHVSFKAAQDLADRAPETSKTQKVHLDTFSLSGQDAKEIAAALVEASKHSPIRQDVITRGLIEVQDMMQEVPNAKASSPEAITAEAAKGLTNEERPEVLNGPGPGHTESRS